MKLRFFSAMSILALAGSPLFGQTTTNPNETVPGRSVTGFSTNAATGFFQNPIGSLNQRFPAAPANVTPLTPAIAGTNGTFVAPSVPIFTTLLFRPTVTNRVPFTPLF